MSNSKLKLTLHPTSPSLGLNTAALLWPWCFIVFLNKYNEQSGWWCWRRAVAALTARESNQEGSVEEWQTQAPGNLCMGLWQVQHDFQDVKVMLFSVRIFSCCHGIQWRQMSYVFFHLQQELWEGRKILYVCWDGRFRVFTHTSQHHRSNPNKRVQTCISHHETAEMISNSLSYKKFIYD